MVAFGKPGTFAPRKDSLGCLTSATVHSPKGFRGGSPPAPPVLTGRLQCVHCVRARACIVCVRACACVPPHARGLAEFQPLSTREPDLEVPVFPSAPLFHT